MTATRPGARTSSLATERERRGAQAGRSPEVQLPPPVLGLMETMWRGEQAAYVVGGCLRDSMLGHEPADWDLTTDAPPARICELFPRSLYENRFGTVVVRRAGRQFEITAFRRESSYSDFRHPDAVQFGDSIEEDLARRDFTVNAMAWGSKAGFEPALVDPHGGREDLSRRLLRAVGDPDRRFREDALRLIRAVRLAATLNFEVEGDTLAAIRRNADLARHLSAERIFAELGKLLASERPSVGLRLMADTGLLAVIAPDLNRQRGVAQNKIDGEDLWDHTLRTVDAAPNRRLTRLAALMHDVGKPDTQADGHFHNHESVGAAMTRDYLDRLHAPRDLQERVAHLVLHHMFMYQPNWTDAAVRRFIGKVGSGSMADLLALRAADNEGSGQSADTGDLPELASRVADQLASKLALTRSDLAIDGSDLIAELGLAPGPALGDVLDALTERVVSEPALNDREILLDLSRRLISEPGLVENPNA